MERTWLSYKVYRGRKKTHAKLLKKSAESTKTTYMIWPLPSLKLLSLRIMRCLTPVNYSKVVVTTLRMRSNGIVDK